MPRCALFADCPYRRAKPPDGRPSGDLARRYCHQEPSGCARVLVHHALGPERLPRDLEPHHHDRARRLITIG